VLTDPGTITMRNSAFLGHWAQGSTGVTFTLKVGSQAGFTTYTPLSLAAPAGESLVMHRFDSGSARGSGHSLARGANTITLYHYRSTVTMPTSLQGVLILNYEADLDVNRRPYSCEWLHRAMSFTTTTAVETSTGLNIPLDDYALWPSGLRILVVTASTWHNLTATAHRTSGEGHGTVDTAGLTYGATGEVGPFTVIWPLNLERWKKTSLESGADLETSRPWRIASITSTRYGITRLVTLSNQVFTKAKTVGGYTGDGSGLTVDLIRDSDDVKVASFTTTTGGAVTVKAFDDVLDYYISCRQDATHLGRSNVFTFA
jgi:hypothetical protein